MADALAWAGAFQDLPAETLSGLAEVGQPRTFAPGDVLLRQGDPSESLHVIVRGRVSVEYLTPGQWAPLVVRELGVGEVVGEMGLLDQAPRSATVTAIDETDTLEFGF